MKDNQVSIQLEVNSHEKMAINKNHVYVVICSRHAIIKYCTNFRIRNITTPKRQVDTVELVAFEISQKVALREYELIEQNDSFDLLKT